MCELLSQFSQRIEMVKVKVNLILLLTLIVHVHCTVNFFSDSSSSEENTATVNISNSTVNPVLQSVTGDNSGQRKLALEDDYYYNDAEVDETKSLVTPEDRLLNCGALDTCPLFPGRDKLSNDFRSNPFKCRCDPETCMQYGDCCWEVLAKQISDKNKLDLQESNPWKCHQLQPPQQRLEKNPNVRRNTDVNPIWALMISECPKGYLDGVTSFLCSAEASEIPETSHNYLFDLPAYSNKTKVLYKNIYCATCHGEDTRTDMLKLTLRLICNKVFSPEERQHFKDHSKYQTGDWSWVDVEGNSTCHLFSPELYTQEIQGSMPNIRYCGFISIDTCPPTGNFSAKTRRLCSSYSQYVTGKSDPYKYKYKNPHCFACNNDMDGDEGELECFRPPKVGIINRFVPPPPPKGVGLNFLFDFGLDDDNHYVGYNMLCHEDEVWDYVRHQCHPMLCGKDHVLKTGVCLPVNETVTGENKPDSGGEPSQNLEKEPQCYRILIHVNDTTASENGTITIKIPPKESETGTVKVLVLEQGNYEKWNETFISICAKNLGAAFEPVFMPAFTYLTMASVGLSLTCLFLHMTLFICLPQLRNLPAKNLFCLTLALFVSQFLFLVFIQHQEWKGVCVTAAISMHYFFLAAFFWMNIMSFDIWRTFAGGIMMRRQSSESRTTAFLKYSGFAWITPFLIVSLAAITDFGLPVSASWIDPDLIQKVKPSYGENGLCWISQRLSLFVFFAVPVFLVILSNLVLFFLTALAILGQHREANRVLKGMEAKTRQVKPSSANMDEVRLWLYVKLALIMGLTWILGFLAPFLGWNWLWYFFVVLNGLKGTFIFVAFDFKWKVWEMIKERFERLIGRKPNTSGIPRRGTGTTTSTSSGTRTTHLVSLAQGTKEIEVF